MVGNAKIKKANETFLVDKSSLKMPKSGQFGDLLKTEAGGQKVLPDKSILAFSSIFVRLELTVSVNTFWPQASSFKNSPNYTTFGIFYELLALKKQTSHVCSCNKKLVKV